MQIKIEPILNCGTIDLSDQTAGARQFGTVDADALAEIL